MEEENVRHLGVTFSGPVTFHGPMFDIHDNKEVHIHHAGIGEAGQQATQPEHTAADPLAAALAPIFYGDEAEVERYLQVVRQARKPAQVTQLTRRLLQSGKISELSARRDLWRLLHEAGLYEPTETNWNTRLRT